MFKEQNVFITGGAGFIMSHVVERLVAAGKNVVIFDNCEEHGLYEETQQLLKTIDNLKFIQGDIRDGAAVREAMEGAEVVYHFAALMGTSSRFKQEKVTIEVNVLGSLNVLEAALDQGVKYFIHPPRPPLTEWVSPYIISKIAQTQFTELFHRTYGLPTIGLNIANCYGPRERSVLNSNAYVKREGKKLVATCILAALQNEPLPVFGDGLQSSDFIYIDDVVEACIRAPQEAAIGKTMEIGTGVNTTVKEVAETIIEVVGSKSKIEFFPMRTGEVKVHTKSDISLAKELLSWEPTTSLVEGLTKTIPYYAKMIGVEWPF